MTDDVIWIVTEEPTLPPSSPELPDGSRDGVRKSPFLTSSPNPNPPATPSRPQAKAVPTATLQANMSHFLQQMGRVLTEAKRSAGELAGMELEEIELAVEINGEGQVGLWGTGTKVGSKGALTLKFKAAKPPSGSPGS